MMGASDNEADLITIDEFEEFDIFDVSDVSDIFDDSDVSDVSTASPPHHKSGFYFNSIGEFLC